MNIDDLKKPVSPELVKAAAKALDAFKQLKNEADTQMEKEIVQEWIDNMDDLFEALRLGKCECGEVRSVAHLKCNYGVCSQCYRDSAWDEPEYEPQFFGKF